MVICTDVYIYHDAFVHSVIPVIIDHVTTVETVIGAASNPKT